MGDQKQAEKSAARIALEVNKEFFDAAIAEHEEKKAAEEAAKRKVKGQKSKGHGKNHSNGLSHDRGREIMSRPPPRGPPMSYSYGSAHPFVYGAPPAYGMPPPAYGPLGPYGYPPH